GSQYTFTTASGDLIENICALLKEIQGLFLRCDRVGEIANIAADKLAVGTDGQDAFFKANDKQVDAGGVQATDRTHHAGAGQHSGGDTCQIAVLVGQDIVQRKIGQVWGFGEEESFLSTKLLILKFLRDLLNDRGVHSDGNDEVGSILYSAAHSGIMFLNTGCLDDTTGHAEFGNGTFGPGSRGVNERTITPRIGQDDFKADVAVIRCFHRFDFFLRGQTFVDVFLIILSEDAADTEQAGEDQHHEDKQQGVAELCHACNLLEQSILR